MEEDICNSNLHQHLIILISKSVDISSVTYTESIELIVTNVVNQFITTTTESFKNNNSVVVITDNQRKTLNEKIRKIGTAAAKSFKADPREFQKYVIIIIIIIIIIIENSNNKITI